MAKRIIGNPLTSGLRGNHIAGHGCLEDDCSEESGNKPLRAFRYDKSSLVRFPNDKKNPEDLNGECIIVQEGRKKDGK